MPKALRETIVEALWESVKSYDLAEVCEYLGLDPQREGEDPFSSKRVYVNARLLGKDVTQLAEVARKVVERLGDEGLTRLLSQLGAKGVSGR